MLLDYPSAAYDALSLNGCLGPSIAGEIADLFSEQFKYLNQQQWSNDYNIATEVKIIEKYY